MRHIPPILLLCLLAACARTPDTNWYILDSDTQQAANQTRGPRVHLRKVEVPAYLDRDAIVTREAGGVRLHLARFEAWAEPLPSGLQRALGDDLAPLLTAHGVVLHLPDDGAPSTLHLTVQVQRFEGCLGGEATLDARWSLCAPDERTIARGSFHGTEPAGPDYEHLIQAQSQLVRRLAHNMAPLVARAARKAR